MKPELTPAQQALMDFLDKLATSPYSPQLMQEGSQILETAVDENRQLQDNIHRASNAIRNVQQSAKLEKGIN
jgi:hypothetical protein